MYKKLLIFIVGLVLAVSGIALAADAGKPLPEGGGDPGKAYMAYYKAITAGDKAAIKKLIIAENAKQMDSPDFDKMFPLMQSMQAKDVKITGGTATDKEATLNAVGKDPMGGGETKGTIIMVVEDKQWKVKKDSWESKAE